MLRNSHSDWTKFLGKAQCTIAPRIGAKIPGRFRHSLINNPSGVTLP